MEGMIGGAVIGAVAGALAGLVVALVGLMQKPKKCPECGAPAPKIRKPTGRRQAVRGGWTCTGGGREMDRRGRKVEV